MVKNNDLIEEIRKKLHSDKDEEGHIIDYSEILSALSELDRNNFIPGMYKIASYEDKAVPIGDFQKSNIPSELVRMIKLLQLKKGDNVLEIGLGSGYSTALIYNLIKPDGKITSYDRIRKMCAFGKHNLNLQFPEEMNAGKIVIHNDNAFNIQKKIAPETFDKIFFNVFVDISKFPLDDFILLLKHDGLFLIPDKDGTIYVYTRSQRNKPFIVEEKKGFSLEEIKHGLE